MAGKTYKTSDFHVGGLPTQLVDSLNERLVAIEAIPKKKIGKRGPNWKKQFLAGFLRAVDYGCVPDRVIKLMWDEGAAAKKLHKKQEPKKYCKELKEAWKN